MKLMQTSSYTVHNQHQITNKIQNACQKKNMYYRPFEIESLLSPKRSAFEFKERKNCITEKLARSQTN
jgi:hypothetical protein